MLHTIFESAVVMPEIGGGFRESRTKEKETSINNHTNNLTRDQERIWTNTVSYTPKSITINIG